MGTAGSEKSEHFVRRSPCGRYFQPEHRKGRALRPDWTNGAGKTTVFNLLTGVYKPTAGEFTLDGENLTGRRTIDINRKGIARTFQNIRLFRDMSVLDNVKVGLQNHNRYTSQRAFCGAPAIFARSAA